MSMAQEDMGPLIFMRVSTGRQYAQSEGCTILDVII